MPIWVLKKRDFAEKGKQGNVNFGQKNVSAGEKEGDEKEERRLIFVWKLLGMGRSLFHLSFDVLS